MFQTENIKVLAKTNFLLKKIFYQFIGIVL